MGEIKPYSFNLGYKYLHEGKEVGPGLVGFDTICEAANFLNNATINEPGNPLHGKPIFFYDNVRGILEEWKREAKNNGCPIRSLLYVPPPPVSKNAADGPGLKPGEEDGIKQGGAHYGNVPEQAKGTPKPDDTRDAYNSKTYGPPIQERSQEPYGPQYDGETGGDAPNGTSADGGDPVDLFSGSFVIHESDLVVPNTVLPLTLARTYRSGRPFPGPFAWNWDHNHNIYLRELKAGQGGAQGDVARWSGNLREDIFHWNGTAFDSPRGVFQKLEKLPPLDPNGQYVIKDVGGFSWFFKRPEGWGNAFRIPLSKVADRYGNMLEYSYDSDDRLSRVTCKPVDQNGVQTAGPYHYLEFTYGNCGLLEKVADSLGRNVRYRHDPDVQRLIKVEYPGTADHPDGTQRVYHYGGLYLPEMLRHNIARVENGRGKVYLENEYDEDPSSWSYGHVVRQVNGTNTFRFRYTPLLWLPPHDEYINAPTQRTEVLDPEGGLTTYTFNFRGSILDRRTRLAKDGSYWITAVAFEYDSQGNRTRMQHLREFEDDGQGTIVHAWGLGEGHTYYHDHADPRMRGLVKKVERLDGNMRETVWEGTYDPDVQLLLTERGPAGDGFTVAAVTTTYQYSADARKKLKKIIHPAVTLPDGTVQTAETQFEANDRGQTTAVITPEGIRHELLYDNASGLGHGRLLKKIADVGPGRIAAEQAYTYDANGFLRTSTDPTGAVTTYMYNILGQIEQVIDPPINGFSSTTVMHYDADGMLVEVKRPRGSYSDPVIQGDHIVDRIVRNILGYVVSSEVGANTQKPRRTERKVDHRGLPVQSADPLGTVSRWKWDERGLLFHHEVTGYDGAKTEERFVYTRDGRIRQEIHGIAKDAVMEYVYGPFGRVARMHHLHRDAGGISLPAAATERSIWSARGYLAATEMRAYPGLDGDELLARTEFRYDARGRMIERTERSFSPAAPFNEATTPKLTTKFFYDRDDRLVKVQGPRGGLTTYTYDGLNRVLEERDPLNNKTVYVYSFADRSVEIAHHDLEIDGVTHTVRKWKRASDARGRLVEAREPDGAVIRYEYDDRNLLTAVVERDGTRREYTYGLLNELLRDTLDPAGLNIVNERSYDLAGRMTGYTDPAGETTTYAYDGIGRLIESLQPGDAAPRAMTYGADGRLASSRLPSGITFSYTYDNAGRLAAMSAGNIPAGIGAVPQHSYSYDLLGRLMTATAGTSTVARAYDSLSRLLKETTHDETLEMAYNDLAGTMIRKWPDGRQETLTTNLNGMVTKIERTAAGGLGAGGAVLGSFTPYGPALLGKGELLGGVETLLSYDERKRISSVKHERVTTQNGQTLRSTLEKVEYRYDAIDRRRGEVLSAGAVQARLHTFDKRDRLDETLEGDQTITLTTNGYYQKDNKDDIDWIEAELNKPNFVPIKYDFAFTTMTGGKGDERLTLIKSDASGTTTRGYSYTNGHRVSAAGTETFTHLTDGTRQTDANNRYEVDALGRVTLVKDPTGATTRTTIGYDALGRVGSITPAAGAARKLSYFGGTLWQEREATGVVRQFTHHPGLPGPMAVHVSGETYQLLHDARMNLLSVTDNAGVHKQRYRYEPFGTPSPAISATGIEPRFGGMRWLNDTSLYLAGARMMDPRHGLWLSHDPLGYADSPNLYAYAAQNPIDYADPTGLSAGGTGGGSANSDGGTAAGGGSGSTGAAGGGSGRGTAKRALLHGGLGYGPEIKVPDWMMDATEWLRNLSNDVRTIFGRFIDSTLGQLGPVGEFFGGAIKRIFDYGLMMTPFGFAVLEEEVMGAGGMFVMTVDALFNPHPDRYGRLGDVISQMPEYFAHMSAGEWGSLTVDMLPALVSGGATAGRIAVRVGGRALGRITSRVPKMITSSTRKGLGRISSGVGAIRPDRIRTVFSTKGPTGGPGITIEQAAAAAHRNGLDLRAFKLEYGGPGPSSHEYGSVGFRIDLKTFVERSVVRVPDGRFGMKLYDLGLTSERAAVETIAHEIKHVRGFLRTGIVPGEAEAEAAAEAAGRFFR